MTRNSAGTEAGLPGLMAAQNDPADAATAYEADAATAYEQVFPATPRHIGAARQFLAAVLAGHPVLDDAVLCLSELATNSVLHSASGKAGGTFTVRARLQAGDHVRVEVQDAGGPWREPGHADGRPHGLEIVRALASGWGREGNWLTGWTVWARIDWPGGRL